MDKNSIKRMVNDKVTDKELLYIKTIAEEGNISVAAKKLFMTQPALSHCLRSLEREMGMPLFDRTSNGLTMTYAGQCYYEMAVSVLGIYNDYRQKLVDISQMRTGRICFGMTRYISRLLSHKLLPKFSAQHPNIEIQITEKDSGQLEDLVKTRKIDFAILHGLDITDKKIVDNLEYTILSREDMCIVMQRGTQWEEKAAKMTGYPFPVLDLKLLDGEKFILETQTHRLRTMTDQICQRANIETNIVLETEMLETAYNLAVAGYGITIINERYIREFMKTDESCCIFSIPKKYKPFWYLCYIQFADGYRTVASQIMIELLEKEERKQSKKQ